MFGSQMIKDETLKIDCNIIYSNYDVYEGGDNEESKFERTRKKSYESKKLNVRTVKNDEVLSK